MGCAKKRPTCCSAFSKCQKVALNGYRYPIPVLKFNYPCMPAFAVPLTSDPASRRKPWRLATRILTLAWGGNLHPPGVKDSRLWLSLFGSPDRSSAMPIRGTHKASLSIVSKRWQRRRCGTLCVMQ